MAKSSTSKSAKKRVNVKAMPEAETKLTGKEMKKVKGGLYTANIGGGLMGLKSKPSDIPGNTTTDKPER